MLNYFLINACNQNLQLLSIEDSILIKLKGPIPRDHKFCDEQLEGQNFMMDH